jgi:hypothetical protein
MLLRAYELERRRAVVRRPPLAPARRTLMRPVPDRERVPVLRDRVPVLFLRVPVLFLRVPVVFLRVPVERARVEVLLRRVPVLFLRVPVLLRELLLFLRVPLEARPRLDVERARLVPVERLRELRAPELRRVLEPPRLDPPSLDSDESSSSSPLPMSFFATPTAAGTATPSAAPATTFWVVDIPSSSPPPFSSFIPSSLLAMLSSRVRDWKPTLFYRYTNLRNADG